MPVIAILGSAVFVIASALFAFIVARPPAFRIERTVSFSAPPAVVFPLINDLHRWRDWSPYEKLDPSMKKSFTGPDSGVGAGYAWSGNNKAGEGKMTITDVAPDERVTMSLAFTRPMKCTNAVNFIITPTADGCQVTWAMDGENTLMGKAFCTFVDMDKMVGKDFEAGLSNLARLVETKAVAA